jgi:putative intracellular protease/amidase
MPAALDLTRTAPRTVLMVIANPSVSTTLGWPVGFWGSELSHPYHEFAEVGYQVTVASPQGGRCELDAFSDPRHESGYSAEDLITMGFLSTPSLAALLDDTPRLADLDHERYDAIIVCGGQAPMFTFRDDPDLEGAIRAFYEAEKPTAALCHGVAALIDLRLSDGSSLIEGKTITGFANVEEDFADQVVGKQVMPWRIEDAARVRRANYVQGGLWKPFAVRDGRLITGQQQYSGGKVAELVIEALGR